ncbi:hypothetical protein [Piscinibacter gummiphilus]|uniref:Uncharacterized protein n=1 Tax=Piscinibacter gummiphilus TaxID=946333 RepID=A0ABZ0CPM8_9BURK|nr:hypothetical protein [Piscinibacter gummiphilus]WOB06471.1 hypothetical protein RXV79_16235 [Piscinibacter gummiphilus]
MKISEIASAALKAMFNNRTCTKATLAINAGGAATVRTTGATIYLIDGVYYTKAALAAQSIAVTHRFNGDAVTTADPAYVQPQNSTVIYVLALNAAGTVAVVQGSYAGQAITFSTDLSKVFTGAGGVPNLPAGYVPFGAIKVVTGATTFTPGTTLLDAANVTATYFDLAHLPESL